MRAWLARHRKDGTSCSPAWGFFHSTASPNGRNPPNNSLTLPRRTRIRSHPLRSGYEDCQESTFSCSFAFAFAFAAGTAHTSSVHGTRARESATRR